MDRRTRDNTPKDDSVKGHKTNWSASQCARSACCIEQLLSKGQPNTNCFCGGHSPLLSFWEALCTSLSGAWAVAKCFQKNWACFTISVRGMAWLAGDEVWGDSLKCDMMFIVYYQHDSNHWEWKMNSGGTLRKISKHSALKYRVYFIHEQSNLEKLDVI